MKFKILFSSLFLTSLFVFPACAHDANFSGFSIGATGGARFVSELTAAAVELSRLNLKGWYPQRTVCVRGAEGGVLAGYGMHP